MATITTMRDEQAIALSRQWLSMDTAVSRLR
jgi:hypothetical protein